MGLPPAVISSTFEFWAKSADCSNPGLGCINLFDQQKGNSSSSINGSVYESYIFNWDNQYAAPASYANGTSNILQAPAPTVGMSATAWTAPANGAEAYFNLQSQLDYTLEIVGPAGSVPLTVAAQGKDAVTSVAAGTFEGYMNSYFTIPGVFYDSALLVAVGQNYSGPMTNEFKDNNTYSVLANTPYTVTIGAQIFTSGSGYQGGGNESLSAVLDPVCFLTGLNASDYTIVLSPGIGNGGAVPEPETWGLLLTGFAGLALIGHRRRKASVAA